MKICPSCKGVCADEDSKCPHCGGVLAGADLTDADALVGMRLGGKYELTQFLGEGAMGWVYRGRHLSLESSVAVKILKPQLRPDEQRAERFKREARAASKLNHPHIISVMDFGETSSGLLYLVTEYLRGRALSDIIAESSPMPLRRAFRLMTQILSALEESHNQGVVHRDLKPDNVMVSSLRSGEDFAKVLDFGIAKLNEGDSAAKLTQAGQLFGTPDYMAPEQIRSQTVDGRADLYSAGVILFELLTGRLPFQADNLFDILKDHLYTEPPTLAQAAPDQAFSHEIEQVVRKALAKEPEERFASARDFQRALRRAVRLATGKVQRCPACQALVRREAKFCPECGYRLKETKEFKKEPAPAHRGSDRVGTADTQLGVPLVKQTDPVSVSSSHPTMDRLWAGGRIQLPMVGRTTELRAITAVVEGKSRGVLITGDLGMGKSTLAFCARRKAEKAGLPVVCAGPHPTLLPLPWHPVKSALAQVLGLNQEAVDEVSMQTALEARPQLSRCRAGLAALFGIPGPLDNVDPANRLAEMRASAIDVLLSEPTRLVIFEDLDLYDAPSLETIRIMVQRGQTEGMRLVLTSAVPLVTGPGIQHLALGPLDRETVSQIIQALQRKQSGSWMHMISHLLERAQGNPLWLEQAMTLLAESGTEASQGLTDMVATRLSRLPTTALQTVQLLAVLGMEASAEYLRAAANDDQTAAGALDLLEHRGIITKKDTASGIVVRFHHPLIFSVARETIPLEARQCMNKAAYEWLGPTSHPLILAHHLLESGLYEQAVDLLETAGDFAMSQFDIPGAVNLYRRTADTLRWKLLAEEKSEANLRLNLKLAEALERSGDLNAANVVLRYVDGLAGSDIKMRGKTRLHMSRILAGLQRPAKAIEAVRNAISDGILAGDVELLTDAYLFLARLLIHTGQIQEAATELDEGLAVITAGMENPSNGPERLWKLFAKAALVTDKLHPGTSSAVDLARQALDLARSRGNRSAEAQCEVLLAHALSAQGDTVGSEQHYHRALAVVQSSGDRLGEASVLFHLAENQANGGAEKLRRQALSLVQELGWQDSAAFVKRRSSATLNLI